MDRMGVYICINQLLKHMYHTVWYIYQTNGIHTYSKLPSLPSPPSSLPRLTLHVKHNHCPVVFLYSFCKIVTGQCQAVWNFQEWQSVGYLAIHIMFLFIQLLVEVQIVIYCTHTHTHTHRGRESNCCSPNGTI